MATGAGHLGIPLAGVAVPLVARRLPALRQSRIDLPCLSLRKSTRRDELDFREKLLIQMVMTQGRIDDRFWRPAWRAIRDALRVQWFDSLSHHGSEPQAVTHFLRFRRKGGWFAELRAIRGLPSRDKKGG